jgi:hypothetical protein
MQSVSECSLGNTSQELSPACCQPFGWTNKIWYFSFAFSFFYLERKLATWGYEDFMGQKLWVQLLSIM